MDERLVVHSALATLRRKPIDFGGAGHTQPQQLKTGTTPCPHCPCGVCVPQTKKLGNTFFEFAEKSAGFVAATPQLATIRVEDLVASCPGGSQNRRVRRGA